MALLLTDDDARSVLTMRDAMDAVEDVFRERGIGRTFEISRSRIYAPIERDQGDFWMNTMAAAVPKLGVAAIRISTAMTQALRIQTKVVFSRKTDRTLLYSTETGEMLAILHNDYVQKLRVGASTGVATKYMARRDASVVGVFGSGRQARANLTAIALARKIVRVKVYSPTPAHCHAYCQEMAEVLNVEASPATPEEVVKGSDIVLTASNSRIPVFQGGWLEGGVHVNSVLAADPVESGHELDSVTISRADIIAVNSREAIYTDRQQRLLEVLDQDRRGAEKICELGEIVVGTRPGRSADGQITVYDNNIGMGIQFAACAALVLHRARERGLGTELSDAHFNEYLDGVADTGQGLERINTENSKAAMRPPQGA